MKTTLLNFTFILFCAAHFPLAAQPVLNYNASHSIGTSSLIFTIGGAAPVLEQTGANLMWDLSAYTVTQMGTMDFMAPANTPYGATYPTANLAFKYHFTGQSESYTYLIDSPTELKMIADGVGNPNSRNWVQPDKLVAYPFNFNDSYTSTRQASGDSPETFTRTYDAYGTLSINGKTYNNIIRVKKNNGNSVWFSTSPVMFPVIIQSNSSTYLYNEAPALLGLENTTSGNQISLFPNPASTELTLQLTEEPAQNTILKIYSVTGQEIKVLPVTAAKNLIDLKEFPAGIYVYQLTTDQSIIKTGKFTVR